MLQEPLLQQPQERPAVAAVFPSFHDCRAALLRERAGDHEHSRSSWYPASRALGSALALLRDGQEAADERAGRWSWRPSELMLFA